MFKIYLDFLFILPLFENLQKYLNVLKLTMLYLNYQVLIFMLVTIYFLFGIQFYVCFIVYSYSYFLFTYKSNCLLMAYIADIQIM